MKKLGVTLLALTLVLTLTFTAFAIPSDWAKAEVDEARANNLIVAEADQNYQDFITRELFCKLIIRMVEEQSGAPVQITIANPFTDTASSEIVKAYQLGIVKGISETQFAPDNLITRQEVAIMMMRAFRVLDQMNGTSYTQNVNVSGLVFNDESSIASWAIQDVKEAFVLGIIKGVGDNTMNPLGNTTVEQSILLTVRLFNRFATGGSSEAETTETMTTTVTIPATSTTSETSSTTSETTTTTTVTATTTETTAPPAPVNQAPVKKAKDLLINIRQNKQYTFSASDIANDYDGDELTFISVERKSSDPVLPILANEVNASGDFEVKSNAINNVDKTATFVGVVSDGEATTTIEFKVKVRENSLAYIQTFEPTVLNVQLGQSKTIRLSKIMDYKASDSVSLVNITPSEETNFGKLSSIKTLGVYYLKFAAKNALFLAGKSEEYMVNPHLTGGVAELKVIVKYGKGTYKPGFSTGVPGFIPTTTNPFFDNLLPSETLPTKTITIPTILVPQP